MARSFSEAAPAAPATAIRLVVQGDDFGMCHAVNVGIARAFREGILTQAAVMAPCPWFFEAARLARHDGIPVGMHCTLTCEWQTLRWAPLSGAASLVSADGGLHRSVEAMRAALDPDEAVAELVAQAERMQRAGVAPLYFDAHMGSPSADVFARVCAHFGRPFLYRWGAPCLVFDTLEVMSERPAEHKRDWLLGYLDALQPGCHFLQTHPATGAEELRALAGDERSLAGWAGMHRVGDLEVLCDPLVHERIRAHGIALVSVRDPSVAGRVSARPAGPEPPYASGSVGLRARLERWSGALRGGRGAKAWDMLRLPRRGGWGEDGDR